MEINKNLKARIVSHFGTQRRFARQVQIPEQMVSLVVRGGWTPPRAEQYRWAEILEARPEELFNR